MLYPSEVRRGSSELYDWGCARTFIDLFECSLAALVIARGFDTYALVGSACVGAFMGVVFGFLNTCCYGCYDIGDIGHFPDVPRDEDPGSPFVRNPVHYAVLMKLFMRETILLSGCTLKLSFVGACVSMMDHSDVLHSNVLLTGVVGGLITYVMESLLFRREELSASYAPFFDAYHRIGEQRNMRLGDDVENFRSR